MVTEACGSLIHGTCTSPPPKNLQVFSIRAPTGHKYRYKTPETTSGKHYHLKATWVLHRRQSLITQADRHVDYWTCISLHVNVLYCVWCRSTLITAEPFGGFLSNNLNNVFRTAALLHVRSRYKYCFGTVLVL